VAASSAAPAFAGTSLGMVKFIVIYQKAIVKAFSLDAIILPKNITFLALDYLNFDIVSDLVFRACSALLKGLTVISTGAMRSVAKWRNLLKNRFLDSPSARSK